MGPASEILFTAAVAWCLFWGYAAVRSRAFLLLMIVLGLLHLLLAECGAYANTTAVPPPQLALLAPVAIVLFVLLVLPQGRAWLGGLPLIPLTALHVLRVPVEMVLHDGYEAGLVPRAMTYSGHNFDIVSGLTAALMVLWMLSKRPPGRGVLIAWNVACTVLLIVVVITAVFSLPSSIQRWNFNKPNVLVIAPPYVLLPALLVPCVLWAHVSALVRLLSLKGSGMGLDVKADA
jgi:hypothetical protein